MTTTENIKTKRVDISDKRLGRSVGGRLAAVFVGIALLAAVGGVFVSGGNYQPSPGGLPDAGPLVSWGVLVFTTLFIVVGIGTIGLLLYAAFLDPIAGDNWVSRSGRSATLNAGLLSLVWASTAFGAAVFSFSNILAVNLDSAFSASLVQTYAWDITTVRVYGFAMVFAIALAIGCFLSSRLKTISWWLLLAVITVSLPALAGHSAGLGDHRLAMTSGVVHAATAALWVGGLLALGLVAWPSRRRLTSEQVKIAASRFSAIALVCVAALALSGIGAAWTRLNGLDDLVWTGYGRLILGKAILLIALIGLGWRMRHRVLSSMTGHNARSAFAKVSLIELVLMSTAMGLGVALSQSAPPRSEIIFTTQGELQLGHYYPPSPTAANVIFGWSFDALFFVLALVAAGMYLTGVKRLRDRGDKWPVMRTFSWLLGLGLLVWATNAGIARYSEVSVSIHMVQHMVLSMMVPIPLVLGAPVTLALRAFAPSPTGGRGPRELINEAIHSPLARFITHPAYILAIYALGLYGLYFTSLFGVMMSNHVGHILMTFHFVATGYLLCWVTIGIDPRPRQLPHWGRLGLVIVTLLIHTFFALALMQFTAPIGASWYSVVQPPWMLDQVHDTVLAGQVAWGVGELPALVLLLIISVQWARSDERESKRRDRFTASHGDNELNDYNKYLAQLNRKNR